jgi:hypothetical protein
MLRPFLLEGLILVLSKNPDFRSKRSPQRPVLISLHLTEEEGRLREVNASYRYKTSVKQNWRLNAGDLDLSLGDGYGNK